MIDTLQGEYFIRCNTCNSTAGQFDTFSEAVTYAKVNGWRCIRTRGNKPIRNRCPECVRKKTARDGNHKAASKNNLLKR